MNDANCQPKQYKHSYLRSTLVLVCVTAMVGVLPIRLSKSDSHRGQRAARCHFCVHSLSSWEHNVSLCATDPGDHRPDSRPGHLQGDRSSGAGGWTVGVSEQPLQHGRDDAGGRVPLLHHHRHDPGRPAGTEAGSWARCGAPD